MIRCIYCGRVGSRGMLRTDGGQGVCVSATACRKRRLAQEGHVYSAAMRARTGAKGTDEDGR